MLKLSCIFSILVSRLLSVTPICFKGFGSFSLSLFRILYQVDSLSLPLLFVLVAFILFLYLLGISLPFRLIYIAVFGVAFLHSGSLWFLFIVEVPPCWWHWMSGLSRSPGRELALVFWWVELDFFSLECKEVSGTEF